MDKIVFGIVGITGVFVVREIIMEKIDSMMMKKIEDEIAERENEDNIKRAELFNKRWELYFTKQVGDIRSDANRWQGGEEHED
ncbi:MAG: hypothetical protein ACRDD8_15880 [Bacteroidales bacterium]